MKNSARIHVVSHSGSFDVVYSAAKAGRCRPRAIIPPTSSRCAIPCSAWRRWRQSSPRPRAPIGWAISVWIRRPKAMAWRSSSAMPPAMRSPGSSPAIPPRSTRAKAATGVFVRHPGDNQSYLARTVFTPHGDLSDWVDTNVMSVDAARVNSVTITPFSGAPYTVSRAAQLATRTSSWTAPPPAKGLAASTSQIDLVPQIVSGFAFTDVKPASELDFSKAAHLAAHTFDNQNIRMDAVKVNDAVWVRVSAQPDPGTPTMQKQEAAMINARAGNWAYELATERGQFFSMTRDSLFAKAQAQGQPGDGQPGEGMPARRPGPCALGFFDRRAPLMAAEAEPLRGLWYMPASGVVTEAGTDAARDAAGRAGAAGPHARRRGLRDARHLPASRRAAVGGKDPAREHRRVPLSWLALHAATACARHPLAGGGPGFRARENSRAPLSGARAGRADLGLCRGQERNAPKHRAAARARPQREAALAREADLPLRHRSRRDRADGPGAWALRPRPLVVDAHAAGEGKTLRAAAHRLRDDGAQAVQGGL